MNFITAGKQRWLLMISELKSCHRPGREKYNATTQLFWALPGTYSTGILIFDLKPNSESVSFLFMEADLRP